MKNTNARVYIKLLRPKQWTKNILVFAGGFFALSFNIHTFAKLFLGFVLFCLASSTIYIFNDIVDKEKDALHPKKKFRPIASGIINVREALIISAMLGVITLFFSFELDIFFFYYILLYILMMILYSLLLKNIVIIDIIIIATGFIVRAIAGVALIRVPLSSWFILSILFLSLFLASSKRRAEFFIADDPNRRKVMDFYNETLLDIFNTIFATSSILTYALYVISEKKSYLASLIFVIYGILRYLYLVYSETKGEEPEKILINDAHILVSVILFVLSIVSVYLLKMV